MRALLSLVLALALAGCAAPPATPGGSDGDPRAGGEAAMEAGAPPVGSPAASEDAAGATAGAYWEFADTEGATHSRDSAAGKPAVLFFMATWCSTCKSKTGVLGALHKEYADDGLQVFSTSVDPSETQEDLAAWKARYAQPWPHGVDPGRAMQRTFDITAQSSFVVLDANGQVVRAWTYPGPDANALQAAVDEAYARAAAA